MTNDATPYQCDGCADIFADDDWSLYLDLRGHYYGFNDDVVSENCYLHLCHDCVLRMIALFPVMGTKFGKGCHQSLTEDEPCCAHSFMPSPNGETRFPNEDATAWS